MALDDTAMPISGFMEILPFLLPMQKLIGSTFFFASFTICIVRKLYKQTASSRCSYGSEVVL
jgi:hypothetical protein